MSTLPVITPAIHPHESGLTWPTLAWPTGEVGDAVHAALDAGFGDPALGDTYAVVLIHRGRLVYERYDNALPSFIHEPTPVDVDTPLLSWSMAKSMLHFLVGTLVDEGRLDPSAPAGIAAWENDERSTITLGDLLAMRDGLNFAEEYSVDTPSNVVEMLFGEGQHDMAAYAASRPLAHEPGRVFNYSSGTTNIISGIVGDLVGRGEPYRDFLQTRLFDAIGMTSATGTCDEAGTFVASSYVHATARDFAKFGLLYLRGGEWDGRRLVSRRWIDTAQIPLSVDEESGTFYSWQWWVSGDDFGSYWCNGYEGQMIVVSPTLDSVLVRLGRTNAERYPDLRQWRDGVLRTLAR